MDAPLALYRRYRPETFREVIGQDHVTGPLRAALANNRANHAYLFSGPRGCGKTTSARILARTLNCAQGPVADPCGVCDSCRDLARGASGSLDVIEIDAASHNGVDDARDLREKAFFSPVRDRYKIYIIDEAHMVTTAAFNALLKLVEEPPPHLRFVFATTEPEKVLPTIRSRTHHYPFRLIPPRLLSTYLAELCVLEQVSIEPAALPLVVRAGAGSARDSLSVLDQLLGGAGPDGVTHELAAGLLGYTPDALLDEVVDAFAAVDGAAVFAVVDKVIETGQDPRRFAEDLLRRLRDLVIVSAVPDAPASGLIDVSEDAGERLVAQAGRFGAVELSRAADLVAAGLTEMRGATAPRLLLELICARVLLPAADDTTDGVLARLDRLERRLSVQGTVSADAPPRPEPSRAAPAASTEPPTEPPAERPVETARAEAPVEAAPMAPPPAAAQAAVASAPAAPTRSRTAGPTLGLVDVRRLWPDIVEATKLRRRVTWMILSQHAQVVAADDITLTLGFASSGARDSFANGGSLEIVRQAAIDVAGKDWRIEAIVDPGAASGPAASGSTTHPAPTGRSGRPPAPPEPPSAEPGANEPPDDPAPDETAPDETAPDETAPERPAGSTAPAERPDGPTSRRRPAPRPRPEATPRHDPAAADAVAHRDDPAAADEGLAGAELLRHHLGATVIDEIPHG